MFTFADKRVFKPYMRYSDRRTHEQNLEWALAVESGDCQELMGMTGKSVFFDAKDFDIVQDMLPETMHLMDGGFMKNTCGRTFNSGASHQTRMGYRRTQVSALSDLIRYVMASEVGLRDRKEQLKTSKKTTTGFTKEQSRQAKRTQADITCKVQMFPHTTVQWWYVLRLIQDYFLLIGMHLIHPISLGGAGRMIMHQ